VQILSSASPALREASAAKTCNIALMISTLETAHLINSPISRPRTDAGGACERLTVGRLTLPELPNDNQAI
jgi:hypothetical protein